MEAVISRLLAHTASYPAASQPRMADGSEERKPWGLKV
jgi:hypothetical protein